MKLVRTIINQAPRDWRAGGVFVRTLLAERIRPHRTHRASERERGRQENFFECVLRYRRPRNRKIDRASPASFDGDGVRFVESSERETTPPRRGDGSDAGSARSDLRLRVSGRRRNRKLSSAPNCGQKVNRQNPGNRTRMLNGSAFRGTRKRRQRQP